MNETTPELQRVTLEQVKAGAQLDPKALVYIFGREYAPFGYWRPGAAGYTDRLEDAGLFQFADALAHTHHCGPEKGIEFRYPAAAPHGEPPRPEPQDPFGDRACEELSDMLRRLHPHPADALAEALDALALPSERVPPSPEAARARRNELIRDTIDAADRHDWTFTPAPSPSGETEPTLGSLQARADRILAAVARPASPEGVPLDRPDDFAELRALAEALRGRWSYGSPRGSDAVEILHYGKRSEMVRYIGRVSPSDVLSLLAALTAAEQENAHLRAALRDAIDRPKGVVPDSALPFYRAEEAPRA